MRNGEQRTGNGERGREEKENSKQRTGNGEKVMGTREQKIENRKQ